MKKLLSCVLSIALLGAAALGMAACGDKTKEPVGDGTNPPVVDDPTPPGGVAKFSFAGSLQTLYGGENGYPQAVLVAKTSVIENDPAAVAAMESYMTGSAQFLASSTPAGVISLLDGCYDDADLARSFNANNLTEEVIANCSVKYTPASDCKETVTDFLTELNKMDSSLVKGVPEDGFYYAGGAAAGEPSGTYSVYAPDGAPALALTNAISQSRVTGAPTVFNYHIVAADQIKLQVTGQMPADFCVLPVNLAANLLRSGEKYKLLGTVTNGNMFLLSTRSDAPTVSSTKELEALIGRKVGVVQLANVPGLTFRLVLEREGIPYKILTEADDKFESDKVNLAPIANAATEVTLAGEYNYFLCPEPAASAKVKATSK